VSRKPRHTEAEVRRAVAAARRLTGAIRNLGLRPAGGNHVSVRGLIMRYGISTAHFDPYWASRRGNHPPRGLPLEAVLVEGSTYNRVTLKRRLYEAGLKERRCELCGQGRNGTAT
jgi:hypothetical protein